MINENQVSQWDINTKWQPTNKLNNEKLGYGPPVVALSFVISLITASGLLKLFL